MHVLYIERYQINKLKCMMLFTINDILSEMIAKLQTIKRVTRGTGGGGGGGGGKGGRERERTLTVVHLILKTQKWIQFQNDQTYYVHENHFRGW